MNLRRNLLMTLAAVLTVAVSLALVGGALLLRQGVQNATVQWRGGVELSIFLKPDVTRDAGRGTIKRQLEAMPEVKWPSFISHEAAYEEFKTLFANQQDIVEALEPQDLHMQLMVLRRRGPAAFRSTFRGMPRLGGPAFSG